MTTGDLKARTDRLLPELERVYTDIHAHPELSMQETRTARIASERLRAAGYDVTDGVGQTGVVGLMRNGDGPTVMLRADMDALPVREQTGLSYASNETASMAPAGGLDRDSPRGHHLRRRQPADPDVRPRHARIDGAGERRSSRDGGRDRAAALNHCLA